MSRAQKIAIRLRWFLLALWILCFAYGVFWVIAGTLYEKYSLGLLGTPYFVIFGPLFPLLGDLSEESEFLRNIASVILYLGAFLITQWLFLCPRSIWKMKLEPTGRPMKRAAIGVGFAVMLLSVGLLYSVSDLVCSMESSEGIIKWMFLTIPAILWCLWSVIFWVYWRRSDYYTWTGRVIRGLIAGSVLELFVAVPIYATRQDDCYCVRGSYAGLIFGTTILLWAFGPGVFLLFVREKHRREKLLEFEGNNMRTKP
jgi:hypothetical protein